MKTLIIAAALATFTYAQNVNAQTDKSSDLTQTLVKNLPTENVDVTSEIPTEMDYSKLVLLLPTENEDMVSELSMSIFEVPKPKSFGRQKQLLIVANGLSRVAYLPKSHGQRALHGQ